MPDAERIGTQEGIEFSWIMPVMPEPGQTFNDEHQTWTVLAVVEHYPGCGGLVRLTLPTVPTRLPT